MTRAFAEAGSVSQWAPRRARVSSRSSGSLRLFSPRPPASRKTRFQPRVHVQGTGSREQHRAAGPENRRTSSVFRWALHRSGNSSGPRRPDAPRQQASLVGWHPNLLGASIPPFGEALSKEIGCGLKGLTQCGSISAMRGYSHRRQARDRQRRLGSARLQEPKSAQRLEKCQQIVQGCRIVVCVEFHPCAWSH